MANEYRHLFGPVPSRRLGRSLGVDLTPMKTCTLNCVFCQLGRSDHAETRRREYVPIADVLAELGAWFREDGKADVITLSGSGEPTLNSRFGEVIDYIQQHSRIPVALLTNGTLLHLPEVRQAARNADIVKASLSAWDQKSFEHINRPPSDITFDQLVEGEKAFREEFKGSLWLEVFILWGINSTPADVKRIASIAETIRPDKIHLNTSVRPPAEDFAVLAPRDHLEQLTTFFTPKAEVIAEFRTDESSPVRVTESSILAMLLRRPCTAEQISATFHLHPNEVAKYLGKLLRTDKVHTERKENDVYYVKND